MTDTNIAPSDKDFIDAKIISETTQIKLMDIWKKALDVNTGTLRILDNTTFGSGNIGEIVSDPQLSHIPRWLADITDVLYHLLGNLEKNDPSLDISETCGPLFFNQLDELICAILDIKLKYQNDSVYTSNPSGANPLVIHKKSPRTGDDFVLEGRVEIE